MKDGVYCSNGSCPLEDCKSHLKHLAGRELEGKVRIAGLYGVCRRYIGWLVEEARETR